MFSTSCPVVFFCVLVSEYNLQVCSYLILMMIPFPNRFGFAASALDYLRVSRLFDS